jgi:hypothetical protein
VSSAQENRTFVHRLGFIDGMTLYRFWASRPLPQSTLEVIQQKLQQFEPGIRFYSVKPLRQFDEVTLNVPDVETGSRFRSQLNTVFLRRVLNTDWWAKVGLKFLHMDTPWSLKKFQGLEDEMLHW